MRDTERKAGSLQGAQCGTQSSTTGSHPEPKGRRSTTEPPRCPTRNIINGGFSIPLFRRVLSAFHLCVFFSTFQEISVDFIVNGFVGLLTSCYPLEPPRALQVFPSVASGVWVMDALLSLFSLSGYSQVFFSFFSWCGMALILLHGPCPLVSPHSCFASVCLLWLLPSSAGKDRAQCFVILGCPSSRAGSWRVVGSSPEQVVGFITCELHCRLIRWAVLRGLLRSPSLGLASQLGQRSQKTVFQTSFWTLVRAARVPIAGWERRPVVLTFSVHMGPSRPLLSLHFFLPLDLGSPVQDPLSACLCKASPDKKTSI